MKYYAVKKEENKVFLNHGLNVKNQFYIFQEPNLKVLKRKKKLCYIWEKKRKEIMQK